MSFRVVSLRPPKAFDRTSSSVAREKQIRRRQKARFEPSPELMIHEIICHMGIRADSRLHILVAQLPGDYDGWRIRAQKQRSVCVAKAVEDEALRQTDVLRHPLEVNRNIARSPWPIMIAADEGTALASTFSKRLEEHVTFFGERNGPTTEAFDRMDIDCCPGRLYIADLHLMSGGSTPETTRVT